MSLIDQIVARAKANKQRIVLPEAEEERTLIAADKVLEQDIADLILIGNPEKVAALAKQHNLTHLDKATLIDPENYERSEELAQLLQKRREKKGMTIEQARELVKNPLYLGCMIIKTEGAIYASKVQLVCPKCDKGVRVKIGTKTVGDKTVKVRLCAKCGAEI